MSDTDAAMGGEGDSAMTLPQAIAFSSGNSRNVLAILQKLLVRMSDITFKCITRLLSGVVASKNIDVIRLCTGEPCYDT